MPKAALRVEPHRPGYIGYNGSRSGHWKIEAVFHDVSQDRDQDGPR